MNDFEKRRLIIEERRKNNSLIPADVRLQKMQEVVSRLCDIGKEYTPYASEQMDDKHQGGEHV